MARPDSDEDILGFLIETFYASAIRPGSPLFLPKLIQAQRNPTYEPYVVGSWERFTVANAGEAAQLVCAGQGEPHETYIPPPEAVPAVELEAVQIAGISNVLPDRPGIAQDRVSGTAALSSWEAAIAPAPMVVSGRFRLTQSCCLTSDGRTCAAAPTPFVGTGTFDVTIKASRASAAIDVSIEGRRPTASVRSIGWSAAATQSNIAATVEIDTIPPGANRQNWNELARGVLNSETAIEAFVQNVGAVLEAPATLASFSTLLAEGLRAILDARG